MFTEELDLGGRVLYLASHDPIETFGLPDGARLIELKGGGTALINRGGRIEVLPPRQPAPVSEPHQAAKTVYLAGEIKTGYILPIGIVTTAAALGLLALGSLCGIRNLFSHSSVKLSDKKSKQVFLKSSSLIISHTSGLD